MWTLLTDKTPKCQIIVIVMGEDQGKQAVPVTYEQNEGWRKTPSWQNIDYYIVDKSTFHKWCEKKKINILLKINKTPL